MTDEMLMLRAIQKCREGIEKSQTPFGACIAKDGKPVSCSHNEVWMTTDITAHAEIVAIRRACDKLGSIDLSGCTIYSTCEPCPMCFSAVHWSRIDRIVYGAEIADARAMGFHELTVSNEMMKTTGGSAVTIQGGFLRDEALKLFREWAARDGAAPY